MHGLHAGVDGARQGLLSRGLQENGGSGPCPFNTAGRSCVWGVRGMGDSPAVGGAGPGEHRQASPKHGSLTRGGMCPRCIWPLVTCCWAWGMVPTWKFSGPPAPGRMMAGRATEPCSTLFTWLNCCCSTVDLPGERGSRQLTAPPPGPHGRAPSPRVSARLPKTLPPPHLTFWERQSPRAWWIPHPPPAQSGPCSFSVGQRVGSSHTELPPPELDPPTPTQPSKSVCPGLQALQTSHLP